MEKLVIEQLIQFMDNNGLEELSTNQSILAESENSYRVHVTIEREEE